MESNHETSEDAQLYNLDSGASLFFLSTSDCIALLLFNTKKQRSFMSSYLLMCPMKRDKKTLQNRLTTVNNACLTQLTDSYEKH